MQQALRNLAYRLGISATRSPNRSAIRELLQKLHPVTVNLPLVRVGGDGDGGYLLPDDLQDLRACFSPGVDVTATFESDMIAMGVPCFLSDASVANAPIAGELIDFQKKFIGVVNQDDFVTMDQWVTEKIAGMDGDLILQMDIEGGEWPVLLNISDDLLQRFRVIVLELHGFNAVFDPFGFSMITSCLDRVLNLFNVVHIHPNNSLPLVGPADLKIPRTLEISLLRKDRASVTGFVTSFPHPLDADCAPERPFLKLPASLHH